MPLTLPDEAYLAHTRGEISDDELAELEKFASTIKEGAWQDSVAHGAAAAGGAMLAGAVGEGIGSAVSAAGNRLTYRRDLNGVLDIHPDLAENYSKRDIHLAYTSLRTMNRDFAKDPLIGGNLLSQILRNRDVLDPSKPPRFDPGLAKDLYTAKPGRQKSDAAQKAMLFGLETGMGRQKETGDRHYKATTPKDKR